MKDERENEIVTFDVGDRTLEVVQTGRLILGGDIVRGTIEDVQLAQEAGIGSGSSSSGCTRYRIGHNARDFGAHSPDDLQSRRRVDIARVHQVRGDDCRAPACIAGQSACRLQRERWGDEEDGGVHTYAGDAVHENPPTLIELGLDKADGRREENEHINVVLVVDRHRVPAEGLTHYMSILRKSSAQCRGKIRYRVPDVRRAPPAWQ
jgi:hypothetical protein